MLPVSAGRNGDTESIGPDIREKRLILWAWWQHDTPNKQSVLFGSTLGLPSSVTLLS